MLLLQKIKNFIWSKRFLKNFVILIAIYVILYLILQWYLSAKTNFGQKIEVPNLIGKNAKNVESVMGDLPLKVEILDSIYDPTKVEGTILEQDPMPTSKTDVYVKEDRTIRIRVSKRTQLIEMPDLVNKSQRFAESVLRNRSFKYRVDYKPSVESDGAVMQQLYQGKPIAAGTKIPIGSTVKLIIGRNEVGIPVELPNLYGLSIQDARDRVNAMMNVELFVVCAECITKADSLAAHVRSQSPEYSEGAVIASGSSITIYATKEAVNPNE
ncbi:MAG: PASTA domain-containing protein [Bacteroidetes bacterium]|nr:MAG: PASTA domain-containing protein [Bacteroidota bacterium]